MKVQLVLCLLIAVTYAAPNTCSVTKDVAKKLANNLSAHYPKSNGDGVCEEGEGFGCLQEIVSK